MVTIINKTPHPVTLVGEENTVIRTFPACPREELIRLKANTVPDEPIDGVATSRTVFGEATGLPEFQEGVCYIVSQMVKNALAGRSDLLVPAEVVRDENGQIIGCRSLGR